VASHVFSSIVYKLQYDVLTDLEPVALMTVSPMWILGSNNTPAWTSDGAKIAFSSSRSGDPETWITDAAGGSAHKITSFRGPDVAPTWKAHATITLPLSAPGVVTGCMLVFILLMGEYLIPALLGGGKVFFVGNALVDLFLQSRNWPFGAACAVALVAIMLVTVTLYMRLTLKSGAMRDQSLV
jgi:hypothetical protein